MTDFLIFIPLLTFLSVLYIFAYVQGQRKKSVVNNSFLLFTFFMMMAPLVHFLIHLPITEKFTGRLYQLIIPIIFSLGFLFLNFVFTLINKPRNTRYWVCLAMCIVSIVILYFFSPIAIVAIPGYKTLLPVPSIWFIPLFILTLFVIPSYAIILCLLHIKKETNIVLFRQVRLVITGAFISTPFTFFTVIIGPLFLNNYIYLRFASLGILINVVFMLRAVQRHFLMSVNIEQIENAFFRLFENSHDSVILMDGQGVAIQVNNSAKTLFNLETLSINREFLEQRITEYDFSRDVTDISATFNCDHGIKHLQFSQSLVKEGDISLGKLLIIRDITLQRKTEQLLLETKNIESIGQLAGGIAHDFNNFLCGIMSNLSLAKMDLDPSSKTAELISLSEKTAVHARDLARQLLTFSKGDCRKNEVFDVVELIHEICSLMTHGSSADISLDLPKTPVSIKADKGQICQVFQNLILNAIESMPHGGALQLYGKVVFLQAETAPQNQAGTFFQVSVADQGNGIAPEHISRIFEPYFTTKPKGNGLGLAIVNSIISKNKGNISVTAHSCKGTVFTLCLPVTADAFETSSRPVTTASVKPGRILIMDDYPTVRLSLALLLTRLGYTVDQASSGNQALEKYDITTKGNGIYQAIITDLTVPDAMGGMELAEELHKRDPALCIIVSSGYSEEIAISRYRDFGFAGVLHKPYNQEELQDVLESVLSTA
jgi:signal transduction histidine kinase/CheY-like chemotaxis protein